MTANMNIVTAVSAIILLFWLLRSEYTGNTVRRLQTKTALSLFFVLAALGQSHPIPMYYQLILTGLLFCMAGDVFLALPHEKTFLFGLISFLFGHIFYIAGFFSLAKASYMAISGYFIIACVSGGVYLWLKPHLGSMKLSVLLYTCVISIMLSGALTIFFNPALNRQGRIMVFIGALLFYISDLFVAKDHFLEEKFTNPLFCLPLYYTGQFLIAFSVGFLNWKM
ncbi:MAG: lysoplasmalogenase [Desulfobacteraceae bacterium]|nr:lysoplasmalogenase [Desulfobacteraceae bacterium]